MQCIKYNLYLEDTSQLCDLIQSLNVLNIDQNVPMYKMLTNKEFKNYMLKHV
jgi:hypothetical protein